MKVCSLSPLSDRTHDLSAAQLEPNGFHIQRSRGFLIQLDGVDAPVTPGDAHGTLFLRCVQHSREVLARLGKRVELHNPYPRRFKRRLDVPGAPPVYQ